MTLWILSLTILGAAAGLEVGPVRLGNNRTHISYGLGPAANNSLLECPYQLSEGETLQQISWILWNGEEQVGTYEWLPSGEGSAEGLLKGVVNLSRDDGDLELTELRYDLGGFYSCAATLTDGHVEKADKWEALIIDLTASSSYLRGYDNLTACTYNASVGYSPTYPPPTVRTGMYSDQRGGFYDEVTSLEWLKIVYANKSIGYSFSDRIFKIDANTPNDAGFRSSLGVTKTDGTYIPLTSSISYSFLWSKEGCPWPNLQEHQMLDNILGRKTCRGQLVPGYFDSSFTVRCEKGYHAVGVVTYLEIVCNETFAWITEDGDEPRLEDLQCVIDNTDPAEPADPDGGSAGDVGSSVALITGTFLLLCLLHQ